MLRDSQIDTEYLLRAMSVASVASGATDRSGNTDNCVEEYVCDVPFAGKCTCRYFRLSAIVFFWGCVAQGPMTLGHCF